MPGVSSISEESIGKCLLAHIYATTEAVAYLASSVVLSKLQGSQMVKIDDYFSPPVEIINTFKHCKR